MTETIEIATTSTATFPFDGIAKASPAQKVLSAFGDWAPTEGIQPCSDHGWLLATHGYKFFVRRFEEGHAAMVLRASSNDVIEIQTLIAYPDRQGYGTQMLSKLCEHADVLGVQLWLDALPFGKNRIQIPLTKLKLVYRQFGFFAIRQSQPNWLCGFHRSGRVHMKSLMLRNPQWRADPACLQREVALR